MSQSIQPPNYLANMPNPQQSFVQGLQLGQGVLGIQQEQQSQEQMKQALGELAANPTTEGIARAMIQFPSLADKLKEPLKSVTETERAGRISSVMPIYAALASGNPDVARERLLEMATAADNSGRTGEARRFRTLADTVRISPDMAMFQIGGVLASSMGPDKFFETFKGFSTLPSTVQQERAEASRTTTQAVFEPQSQQAALAKIYGDLDNASQRLGLDAEKARNELIVKLEELRRAGGQLSGDAEKRRNDAVVSSIITGQMADQYGDLARQIEGVITQGGFQARGSEVWKRFFGSQNEVTRLRTEYTRLKNAEVARIIPKPASDTDLKVFMEGFLDANANPEQLAAGLRSMSRLARIEAETKNMEAEWLSTFGGLQNASRGAQIMGVEVRQGTSLRDFTRAFVTIRASQMAPRQESEIGASLLNRYGQ
jgi:hypothetical protein